MSLRELLAQEDRDNVSTWLARERETQELLAQEFERGISAEVSSAFYRTYAAKRLLAVRSVLFVLCWLAEEIGVTPNGAAH